jgi:hypothetical protein
MLGQQKSDVWMRGAKAANIETGGGRERGGMYQEMVYYNRMHVKTRLSQSILSKIVAMHFHRTRWENYLINNNIIDKIICIFLHFVPSHMKKLWFFIG